MSKEYEIRLFGGLSIKQNGKELEGFASEKVKLILAYLICVPGTHPRSQLTEMLWENSQPKQAGNNMRTALASLRKCLPNQINEVNRSLSLQNSNDIWSDIDSFNAVSEATQYTSIPVYELLQGSNPPLPLLTETANALQDALSLYTGDLLYGVKLRNASGYEDWMVMKREAYHQAALRAADQLASHFLLKGEWDNGLDWAKKIVDLDGLNEEGHRKLMVLLSHTGQRHTALAHYDRLVHLFDKEFGAPPSQETSTLFTQIYDGTLEPSFVSQERWTPIQVPRKNEGAEAESGVPHNLKKSLSPFVGREDELAWLKQSLSDPERRLITIVGAGGMGKTRLAEEIAWQIVGNHAAQEHFVDGIYFVPLASTFVIEYIPYQIAQTLNIDLDGSRQPLQALIAGLKNKNILFILDNFEHLIEGSEVIQQILLAVPTLTFLITSQEALKIRGEWRQNLAGLRHDFVPLEYAILPLYSWAASEHSLPACLRLFLDTASQIDSTFQLTPDNLPYIEEICRQLEGMPLGIELAAALITESTCESIAEAVTKNKDSLESELKDIPERQRNLRAVFDYSWSLLKLEQQELLIRLAVFKGGFTHKVAQIVVDATAETLELLCTKSLLKQSASGRYSSHMALHQYMLERLEKNDALHEQISWQHAEYYAKLMTNFERMLVSDHGAEGLEQMAIEIRNISQAWEWGIAKCSPHILEPMIPPMTQYLHLRGASSVGESFFNDIVELLSEFGEESTSLVRLQSHILVALSRLQQDQSDYPASITNAQAAIQRAEEIQARDIMAQAHYSWGISLSRQGNSSAALEQIQKAYKLAEEADNLDLMGHSLYQIAVIEWQLGHYNKAYEQCQRSEEIYQSLNDYRGLGNLNVLKGILASLQGEFAKSCTHYDNALAIYEMIGNLYGQSFANANAGRAWAEQGLYAKSRTYYARALQISQQIGNELIIGNVLLSLGRDAILTGDFAQAEAYLHQAMEKKVASKERRGQGEIWAYLTLLAMHQGAFDEANVLAQKALKLAKEVEDISIEAFALMNLGATWEGMEEIDKAEHAYQTCYQLRQSLGQVNLAIEPLAGMVRINHLRGEVAEAQRYMELITSHLRSHSLDGTDDPIRIFYSCYQFLKEIQAPTALHYLAEGYQLLQSRAAHITDPSIRSMYFDQVPSHYLTIAEYTRLFGT
ncbi:MAG: tetratricopeptide repeat protein [Chloroflexota bacterium]